MKTSTFTIRDNTNLEVIGTYMETTLSDAIFIFKSMIVDFTLTEPKKTWYNLSLWKEVQGGCYLVESWKP